MVVPLNKHSKPFAMMACSTDVENTKQSKAACWVQPCAPTQVLQQSYHFRRKHTMMIMNPSVCVMLEQGVNQHCQTCDEPKASDESKARHKTSKVIGLAVKPTVHAAHKRSCTHSMTNRPYPAACCAGCARGCCNWRALDMLVSRSRQLAHCKRATTSPNFFECNDRCQQRAIIQP
jgi:hypothetical protein